MEHQQRHHRRQRHPESQRHLEQRRHQPQRYHGDPGGGLELAGISQVNSAVDLGGTFKTSGLGTVSSTSGTINLTGTLINDGILALTDATGPLYMHGGTILGGTVTTSGNAELILALFGGAFDAVTLAGIIDGTLLAAVGTTVTNGLILNNGIIKLEGINSIKFNGSQTLSGTGTVSISSGGLDGLIVPHAGDILTIAPGITVSGHGFVGSTSGGAVTLSGTIAADDGGTVKVEGATNFANGMLTGGTWKASGNSTLRILGAQISTNNASITLSGSGSHLYSDTGTTDALSGLTDNAAAGQLTLIGGASVVGSSSLTNSGTVTLGPNSSLAVAEYTQDGGSTSLQGGTLTTSQPDGAEIQAGGFSGPGFVQGNVTNAGSVDLGSAAGTLSITGDYTQSAYRHPECEAGREHAGVAVRPGQHDRFGQPGRHARCQPRQRVRSVSRADVPDPLVCRELWQLRHD